MDGAGGAGAHRVVDRLPVDLAERVAEQVRELAGDDAEVRLGDQDDRRRALLEEQQEDTRDVVQGPPLSSAVISGAQARGALVGALVFGGIGLVVGVLVGLIPLFGLPIGARIGLWALVATLGAAASGFVFGGGREPELEGATIDESQELTVGVESQDPWILDRARHLMQEADLEAARRARVMAKHDRPQGTL